jgi:hydroxyacylglutathione hydrolase
MKLIAIPSGPIGTNAWLLINENNNEAILFDAPPNSYNQIMKEAESNHCTIKALIITHGHWDHMLDSVRFTDDGIPLYAHSDSNEFMEHPEFMSDFAMPGLTWKGTKINFLVDHGDLLDLCGIKLEIRTTPGHCPGSIIIYIEKIETAIVGDVIFAGSIGRTDLPGGDFNLLNHGILNKVYTLPDNTVLCTGHGPNTTVENEKKTNPFVRLEE